MGHAEGRACLPEDRHSEAWQTNLMGYAEGHACLSEERQSEIRQTNLMGHAEGWACLSEERWSKILQTNWMGHAEGHARGGKPWSITALRFKIMVKSWWKIGSNQGETQWDDGH
jgi:hypothetical protein